MRKNQFAAILALLTVLTVCLTACTLAADDAQSDSSTTAESTPAESSPAESTPEESTPNETLTAESEPLPESTPDAELSDEEREMMEELLANAFKQQNGEEYTYYGIHYIGELEAGHAAIICAKYNAGEWGASPLWLDGYKLDMYGEGVRIYVYYNEKFWDFQWLYRNQGIISIEEVAILHEAWVEHGIAMRDLDQYK